MSTNLSSNALNESSPSHSLNQPPLDMDSDLWRRLKLGDERAVAALYDRYARLIYNVAHQVLRDHTTSEDVLQEVFFQLWRVPDAFDPAKGSLRAWVTVVSRRRAIDRLRGRKAEMDVAELTVSVDARQLLEAAVKQIASKVRVVLADMPLKSRVTFELAYMHGLTHTEISQRLGEPLGTTKSRIRQALAFIRKRLECTDANAGSNGHVR
jgi:RNA polymerase sigma-70 factor (ECF subfamily)